MLSLDKSVLNPAGESIERMRMYAGLCEELHIVVFGAGAGDSPRQEGNIFLHPAQSASRALSLFYGYAAGKKILSGAGGEWVITSQDPFELGFIAWRLSRRFGVGFEAQLHGDFYGNNFWRKERLLNRWRWHLGRFVLRRAGSVRVVSRRIADSLKFIEAKKIIRNPIFFNGKNFPDALPPLAEEQEAAPFRILAVGNLVAVKNHKSLLRAFAEIKKELPGAKLVIAGGGPLEKDLRLKISDLELEKDVELVGHQKDLTDYYRAADIFVHPSLYEGWGRAVVEAASFGLPIVMSDVGLAGELIKNEESGLIVPVGDVMALRDAALRLAKDGALRQKLGAAAKEAVLRPDGQAEYLDRIKKSWETALAQPAKNRNSMNNFFKKNKIILSILLLALAARLIYFGVTLKNFGEVGFYLNKNGDAAEYFYAAKNILERGIFSIAAAPPFSLEIFRTPGYPVFIAILYKIIPSVAWVIFWQNVLFVGFIFAIYLFVKRYFNSGAALIASLFLSFEPSIIYVNNQLLSENIFTIVVFGVFVFAVLAVKRSAFFAAGSGLLLAAALYLRPIGEYLTVVFCVFYLSAAVMKKISWKKFVLIVLLSVLAFYAAIFPWMARNKKVFGYYAMTTSSSVTVSRYALAIAGNLKENDEWIPKSTPGPIVRYIVSHPFVFGKVYAMSLAMFFFGDSYLLVFDRLWPGLEDQRLWTYWPRTFPELYKLFWGHRGAEAVIFWSGKIVRGIIVSLFLAGVFLALKNKKNRLVLFGMALLIFYFTVAAGAVSYSRFRFAVEPYIYAFVGIAVICIIERYKNAKKL